MIRSKIIKSAIFAAIGLLLASQSLVAAQVGVGDHVGPRADRDVVPLNQPPG